MGKTVKFYNCSWLLKRIIQSGFSWCYELNGLQDVLKKGAGGYKRVVAAFGEDILQANGEVDRPKLGQIVFSDPGKRQLLNRYSLVSGVCVFDE
jgi:dephospho-CoA kinase